MTRWIKFGIPIGVFVILFGAGIVVATWMGSQFGNHDARIAADFLFGVIAGTLAFSGASATWSFFND